MAIDIPDWTQGHILTPILLGTLQWGSMGGTITIPIPAGYADFWVTGGGLGFNGVQGSPSGIAILATAPGVFTLGDVPKSGANFDTGFTLSAAGGVGHSGRVQIYALPATALVYGDPDLPLPVRITQQGGVDQLVNLDQVGGVAVTLGQKTMAASVPVAIASDQSAFAVSQSGGPWSVNLTQVGGAAMALGGRVMANSIPVVVATDQVLTERTRDLEPDFQLQSASAVGTVAASFTITPPAGKRVLIHRVYFDQGAPGGATAAVNGWTVSGPTSGNLARGYLATTATVGDKDHGEAGPLVGALNEVLTVTSGIGGSTWTACRASGWYI